MNPTRRTRALRAQTLTLPVFLLALAGCSSTPPPQPLEAPAPARTAAPAAGTVAAKPATGALLDGVAAIVNDDVILKSELDAQVSQAEQQIQARHTSLPARDVLQK